MHLPRKGIISSTFINTVLLSPDKIVSKMKFKSKLLSQTYNRKMLHLVAIWKSIASRWTEQQERNIHH